MSGVTITERPIRVSIGPGSPRPIVVTQTTANAIRDGQAQRAVLVRQQQQVVVDRDRPRTVGVGGKQGLPGPPGPVGPPGDAAITRPAAETISALRVVYEGADGVALLDPTQEAHVLALLGLSITGGSAGDDITILRGSAHDDAGWNWNPGLVFAGPNGTLTQTPPTSGWEIVVGYAPSPTRLNLTFDEPILL
ncbi:MAG TPA: hypothetical protein VGK41_01200 [Solirubrobacterales bacterium]